MSEDDVAEGDTFGVGVRVAGEELRFLVHVPSDIDAGWTDPEAFQERIEAVTWEHLDREATLGTIARECEDGETVTLGTVTLRPDGTVVEETLTTPAERERRDSADRGTGDADE